MNFKIVNKFVYLLFKLTVSNSLSRPLLSATRPINSILQLLSCNFLPLCVQQRLLYVSNFFDFIHSWLSFTFVSRILILAKSHLFTNERTRECFKNNIKIYIKIAPTCFGAERNNMQGAIILPISATYTHQHWHYWHAATSPPN